MKTAKPFLMMSLVFLILGPVAGSLAGETLPADKRAVPGLYVDAQEAFVKWQGDPEKIRIIDVRTPAEYMFVGHAPMAFNIPLKFLTNEIDPKENKPVMRLNDDFVTEIKKKFAVTDTLLVMCRSGNRSAIATNLLAEAGFKHVYSVIDGFEGDALSDPGSYNDGKRLVNGWKNSGSPWTYKLDPKLMYLP